MGKPSIASGCIPSLCKSKVTDQTARYPIISYTQQPIMLLWPLLDHSSYCCRSNIVPCYPSTLLSIKYCILLWLLSRLKQFLYIVVAKKHSVQSGRMKEYPHEYSIQNHQSHPLLENKLTDQRARCPNSYPVPVISHP